MIENGALIAGKYRVERCLGRGGMGYVLEARHEHLGESVAIKFMVPELSRHPEAILRFLREARAAFRIKSEHVARVLDAGEHDGAPYMVIEFLSGHDLSKELEERGVLPPSEAADFVIQVCDALAAAHALGIIHRDLKPSNLFLTRRSDGSGLIKVLDFGISKALDDPDGSPLDSLTISHRLLGSPHYMSPEQARTPKAVDARSDIWSLGVVLYELLTGRRPFDGDTPVAVLASLLSDSVTQLVDVEITDLRLLAVIHRCLSRNPSDRYANVGELAAALLPVASAQSTSLVARIEAVVRGHAAVADTSLATARQFDAPADATLLSAGSSVVVSSTLRERTPESVHLPLVGAVRPGTWIPALLLVAVVAIAIVSVRAIGAPESPDPPATVWPSRSAQPSATAVNEPPAAPPPPAAVPPEPFPSASARVVERAARPAMPPIGPAKASASLPSSQPAPRATVDPKNQPE